MPAPNYTDAQLSKFISASQKVAVISQEYTPKLQASKDEASQRMVVKEADDRMVQAVHEEGLTVDQFNGLNQAVQQDPKLLQRIQGLAKNK